MDVETPAQIRHVFYNNSPIPGSAILVLLSILVCLKIYSKWSAQRQEQPVGQLQFREDREEELLNDDLA
jgi:hypothetical protein